MTERPLPPCSFDGIYATPEFQSLFLDHDNALKPTLLEKIDANTGKIFFSTYYLPPTLVS